ncbi:hypothetical protein BJ138DRAFT_1119986 [Hygrophoropsis aurantiaca]|uniref:Uncharacterized protein n=1 Tax=Hygrophoropsis aurantiaca TaxID=72124 RepID=A0ACB7ZU36_9AGAM|nr:hypothetical protein BJ138DRAFT_1119986 [Hygrophoropsis aurantiaca]
MADDEYKPCHELSTISKGLHRNFFIWSERPYGLAGGLHLDPCNNPISVTALYRWIDLILNTPTPFDLFHVQIAPVDLLAVFTYRITPVGDALPRTSTELLRSGDVGIIGPGELPLCGLVDGRPACIPLPYKQRSFFYLEAYLRETHPETDLKYRITRPLIKCVRTRDHHCCVITGTPESAGAPLTATWICPPFIVTNPCGHDSNRNKAELEEAIAPFLTVSNGLTFREDIAELFSQNSFGIDVDDNYRIVFFGPHEDYAPLHPRTHLDMSHTDPATRPSDVYLRQHFIRCLKHVMLGGDVYQEYQYVDLTGFLEARGVYDGEVDPADPEWLTPYGKAAWDMLIRHKLRCSIQEGGYVGD